MSIITDLRNELARDRHLAANAARQIAEGVPIEQIDALELDALETWVSFELQDRSRRCYDRQILIDEANPF